MRRFIIEREIPAVGSLERDELRAAAQRSNEALAQLAPDIQWVDYTKLVGKALGALSVPNHSVTFSWSGENEAACRKVLGIF